MTKYYFSRTTKGKVSLGEREWGQEVLFVLFSVWLLASSVSAPCPLPAGDTVVVIRPRPSYITDTFVGSQEMTEWLVESINSIDSNSLCLISRHNLPTLDLATPIITNERKQEILIESRRILEPQEPVEGNLSPAVCHFNYRNYKYIGNILPRPCWEGVWRRQSYQHDVI